MLSDFTVFTSRNGVEALKAIEENPDIDLVVLDLNMPVMDVTIVDTSSYTS
jgi:CheY-like chemotaxis protein